MDSVLQFLTDDEVIKLLKQYSFPLELEELDEIYQQMGRKFQLPFSKLLHRAILKRRIKQNVSDPPAYVAAQLAKFFGSCSGELEIDGVITTPEQGEVKGSYKKIKINNPELSAMLMHFLHAYIYHWEDGLFEFEGIFKHIADDQRAEDSEPEVANGVSSMGIDDEVDSYYPLAFVNYYSDDQLDVIIRYFEGLRTPTYRSSKSIDNNYRIGQRLSFVKRRLTELGVFSGDVTETKKCSFLYDWCALQGVVSNIGDGYAGEIGREKCAWVRNRIRTFEKKASKN